MHFEGEACAVWADLKAQVDFPLSEKSVVVIGLFERVEDVPDVEADPSCPAGDGAYFACGTQSVKRVALGFLSCQFWASVTLSMPSPSPPKSILS